MQILRVFSRPIFVAFYKYVVWCMSYWNIVMDHHVDKWYEGKYGLIFGVLIHISFLINSFLLQVFADDVDIGVNGMVTYDLVPTERNVTVDPQSVSFFLKPFCFWLKTGKGFFGEGRG